VCTDDSVISRRLMDVVRDLDRPLGVSKGKGKGRDTCNLL